MIVTPAPPRPGSAGERLLRALAAREHAAGAAAAPSGPTTLFLCPAPDEPVPDPAVWLRAAGEAADARLLVVTRLGTHPDATAARLSECWALEEAARAAGRSVLVLRLGPMLGPASPLWLRLRAGTVPPHAGSRLVNPVAEEDVVETLERALAGRAAWEGWYEVAGPEVWTLAELVDLARAGGPPTVSPEGSWEPPLAEIAEHRLAEAGPWLEHFRLSVRPLAERAREWVAVPVGSGT